MPGPAEFYGGVRPPTYPSPEPINFNVLGDLLQAYQQGQQYARQRELQTMFQPGTPGAAALSQAGIDPNSLYGLLARSGGAETVAPFAQQLQRGQIYQNIMRGAPGFQSPVGPQSSAEPQEGPNANVASALKNAIYGQESNYGRNPSTSSAGAVGPMQILPSTFAAYAQPGENIRDPIANKNVGDRILDNYLAKYNGDWARAAVAYYSGEGNVAPPGSPTPWKINKQPRSGPSVAGYVQQVGARMRGAGQGANAGTATGTSAPAPNESVGQNIGSPPPFAPMLAAAQSTNAAGPQNIKLTSASGDLSGMLLSPQEPASEEVIPTSSMEVASNQGQGAGASPVAGPITPGGRDTLSQAPTPQTGRPQPSGSYQVAQAGGALPSAPVAGQLPGNEYTPQVAERYRAAARRLRAFTVQSGIAGAASGLKVDTKAYEDQAAAYDRRADHIDQVLSERAKEEYGAGLQTRTKEEQDQLKFLQDTSEQGYEARSHIGQLEAIRELGEKAPYGGFVKLKQLLGNYGIPTAGLTDIQAYQAAIDFMAPQLRPPGSGRLMANEMTGFRNALGGLLTTPEGRQIAVNNLKLMSEYKLKVGAIARDRSLSPSERMDKMADVEFPRLQTSAPGTKDEGKAISSGPLKPGSYIWTPEGLKPK